jgi:hypothetical protein
MTKKHHQESSDNEKQKQKSYNKIALKKQITNNDKQK